MDRPSYINWLIKKAAYLEDGHPVECYLIDYSIDDDLLDAFALHIRRHYISDSELNSSCRRLSMPTSDYLREYVVPQSDEPMGASTRSADITEIIISDLIQFVHGYTTLRGKFHNRPNKNSSEQGTDVISYRFKHNSERPSTDDELIAIEVKASLSKANLNILGSAVEDSQKKDQGDRMPRTLNYLRRKSELSGNQNEANVIARFQNRSALSYKMVFGASAITTDYNPQNGVVIGVTKKSLSLQCGTVLFLLYGKKLMELANMVFERCTP